MSDMTPVRDLAALEAAWTKPRALIFKHSTSCGRSAAAFEQVEELVRLHPDVPLFLVQVAEQRPLSNWIATKTGVVHQSPQAFVLRDGVEVWHASHERITTSALEARLGLPVEEEK